MVSKNCSYVVGVTETTRTYEIIEQRSTPEVFVPLHVDSTAPASMPRTLIANVDPAQSVDVAARLKAELNTLLPGISMRVRRSAETLAPQYRPWEVGAQLFTAFGVLALVVSAIGMYSVIAYELSQRTREFGVRIALGAQIRDLLDLVAKRGMTMIVVGVAIGTVTIAAVGRYLSALLFGVSTTDPFVLIGAACALVAVALVAMLIPALRATRISPSASLRAE
jgi:ABC-type antimicrobial peptide transport system permease subunit